jgi:large subunit ribosomal protein L10
MLFRHIFFYLLETTMAKTKAQKQAIVEQYKGELTAKGSIIVFKPNGISANEASTLKKELYDVDSNFNVVKNTLFKVALKEADLPEVESFEGNENAVIFCTDGNITESAKILKEFIKETEKGEIQAGILNGQVIDGAQVTALADLPSKDQLIGQLLSVFNGPMRGLVSVLNGNMRELVYALNAIQEAKA